MNILVFPSFFKVFQAQILQKYPRRSCGSFWSGLELWRPTFDRFRLTFPFFFHELLCFSPQRRRPRQRLRPRLLRLNGNLVASTTIAAAQRRFGGYDHGNGYDHDCCGSTTAAITTLGMVSGPVVSKIKGKSCLSIFWGVN